MFEFNDIKESNEKNWGGMKKLHEILVALVRSEIRNKRMYTSHDIFSL